MKNCRTAAVPPCRVAFLPFCRKTALPVLRNAVLLAISIFWQFGQTNCQQPMCSGECAMQGCHIAVSLLLQDAALPYLRLAVLLAMLWVSAQMQCHHEACYSMFSCLPPGSSQTCPAWSASDANFANGSSCTALTKPDTASAHFAHTLGRNTAASTGPGMPSRGPRVRPSSIVTPGWAVKASSTACRMNAATVELSRCRVGPGSLTPSRSQIRT